MNDCTSSSFSTLQYLLKLSYSESLEDQQKAAYDLSQIIIKEKNFPAVSFGPLSHSLCHLLSSSNSLVILYAAKGLKILLLDDSLRSQALHINLSNVLLTCLKNNEDNSSCLKEILSILQILTWDKLYVKNILHVNIIKNIIDLIEVNDQEISLLALAIICNLLYFSDTILLGDTQNTERLAQCLPLLVEILRDRLNSSQNSSQLLFIVAAIANASANPKLMANLNDLDALKACKDLEQKLMSGSHLLGNKLLDCVQTAIYRLSDKKEGESKLGNNKYNFKWGTTPVMELTLSDYTKNNPLFWICMLVWILVVILTFSPLIFV